MSVETAVLTAGIVGELSVLTLALRAKLYRTFPMFCIYIGWTIFSDVVAYWLQHFFPAETFAKLYPADLVLDSSLQFLVLVELAWSVLRPVRASLPRATIFVLAALIAIAGIAIWPIALQTLPPHLSKDGAILVQLQGDFAILRIVCFLVIAGFSQVLSIGWRDRELQVATGFGFFSIVSLVVMVYHSHQDPLNGAAAYHWLDAAPAISYLGTLTYWVVSFATKEQERKEFSPQMQQLLLLMSGGARTSRIALSDLPSDRLRKKD